MNLNAHQPFVTPEEIPKKPNKMAWFFLHFFMPLVVLACGVVITVYLLKTSPEAKPKKKSPTVTLVEVQTLVVGHQPTIVQAMGEVIPARVIELKPGVSGEVTHLSDEFLPGGYFTVGQKILQIDPVDYDLKVEQLESEVRKAESDLLIEMGNQRIAEKELILLNEKVSAEERVLILRKPQLAKLQANKVFAETRLAQARLDLQRTKIVSPFNAVVSAKEVNIGTRVTPSTVLARLVDSDVFWLRLTVPVEQLQWIDIPDSRDKTGSTVRIYNQSTTDSYRKARVIRLAPSLEEQGRMAQLIVEINDPFSKKPHNQGKPILLLGSYVRAEVDGRGIDGGIAIDRAHIHNGSTVWLMDSEGLLEIRDVEIIFRSREQVIIKNGLQNGDRIVTSPLSSPINGTPLRLANQKK